MHHAFLTGLVLAAASSRRLSRPKQWLPYRETTLLGWGDAQAEASPELDEVLVVVVGHAGPDVLAGVALNRARPVLSVEFSEGCAASYRAGLAAANPRTEGIAIVLGDQPGMDAEVIGRVAAGRR
jgi:molybdenum cofactor cytidylyltransferase